MDGLWITLGILGGLLVLLALVALLGRVRGGRYVRPLFVLIAKVPLFRRLMQKASLAQLERENPELARAVRKIEAFGTPKTPEQVQTALNRLTPRERQAYLAAAREQQEAVPEAANRQQRRQLERQGFAGPAAAGGRSSGGGRSRPKKKKRR